ncbi:hypothetical protein ACQ4PT_040959 [Festuca glaucescens]
MAATAAGRLLPLLLLLLPLLAASTVTYDHRSLIIDGRRRLLISASIHYPRSVPAMWPKLVAEAKEGGADCIETYVFWNGHETAPGQYYFEDRFDLVQFVRVVKDAGLYLMLRIGPFVAAEWNFGGVPVWLHYIPGTVFRTNNEPFKSHMQSFTTKIVDMMKKERFFASQGGHIILAQVENEYGDYERGYGAGGKAYAEWAASMALAQNIGVPWIMCQQYDAPDHVADVYTDHSGGCVAFLANVDSEKDKVVTFRNRQYDLPAWSVSILPDCKNVVFNTAKVQSQTMMVDMVPETLQASIPDQWSIFREKIGIWDKSDFVRNGFVDLINTTKDSTDYLWHTTSLNVDRSYPATGNHPVLNIHSKGHAVHAFLNNMLIGSAYGNGSESSFSVHMPISLKAGKNEIALLSMTVGLKIGLEGEHYSLYKPDQGNNQRWRPQSEPPKDQPLTWYKVNIDVPEGDVPVGIDMQSMGKGLVWLNGNAIGRYFPRTSSTDDRCTPSCNYRGQFSPNKCRIGCGKPTQRWYHVPRSWFHPSGNTLVVFEEHGGDPMKITFSRRVVTSVCSFVSENFPSIDLESWDKSISDDGAVAAKVQLSCPKGKKISSIKFASFGDPSGTCRSYQQGSCHHPSSLSVVEKACLNIDSCTVTLSEDGFGKDLCPGVAKTLAIEADCS